MKTRTIWLLLLVMIIVGCSSEPENFEEVMKAGQRAYVDKDYPKARKYFLEAYKEQPSNKDVLFFLGVSYARDFIYDSAYSFLRRADLLHPNDRAVNLELYPLAIALDEWTQAILSIRVLIATGDPPSMYYRDLAELHAEKEQYILAYHYLRQDLDQKPEDTNTYIELANLAGLGDSATLGLAILDTAEQKFGRMPQIELARANKLALAGRYPDAEKIYRDAINEGNDNPRLRLSLASVLIPQNSRDKRMEAYHIMKGIRDSTGSLPGLDSALSALKDTLGITDKNVMPNKK
jgi:tetratricopeptide (TPR) repeat protein